ncbi:hypothetical protein [Nitrososphaera sp.]|uniref:hypothetical protein n=1 Tax=Nitrososphaera sp. TaxID=1971748 RepID=UPI00307D9659
MAMAPVGIAGLLFAIFLVAVQFVQTKQVEAFVQPPVSTDEKIEGISVRITNAEEHVNQTGKSAVKVELPINEVKVKKGSTATVNVNIKHIGGENGSSYANVKVLPPTGYLLYPPSLAKSTSFEQRQEAMLTGKQVPGSIDLGTLITYAGLNNNSIAIPKGNIQSVVMNISIPNTLPGELVGTGFPVPIILQVTDDRGNSDTVLVENSSVNVEVIP